MFYKLKQAFCNHHFDYKYRTYLTSKREGDDNYVIETKIFKCERCGKNLIIDFVDKIEKDFYKNND